MISLILTDRPNLCTPSAPSSRIYHLLILHSSSYAWGSRDEPVHIEVGSSGTHTLSVTRNLGTALLYLRYHDRPRKLWIDAICVNQNDLEERSRQVPRMSDIYSKASRVVVWLGQATKHTPAALETVEHIASKVVIDFKRGTMCSASSKHSERHWGDRYIDLPDKRRVSQVISDLLIREWFERLWVWVCFQQICKMATCSRYLPILHKLSIFSQSDFYSKRWH